MLSSVSKLFSRPVVGVILSLLTLAQFLLLLFLLPLDIPRWYKAGDIWEKLARSVWEAPMLRDVLLVGISITSTLFLISIGFWIESRWERLKKFPRNFRASRYLQRRSVRGRIRRIREAIQGNDYSAIFRGIWRLYPDLRKRGIFIRFQYDHRTGQSFAWRTPLDDPKWLKVQDSLLSELERMPGGWRLLGHLIIDRVSDFDFDADRWRGEVKRRDKEWESKKSKKRKKTT